jgi:hypothetical protein
MTNGGLDQAEALQQVKWLVTCGMVDMVELSGGSAEQNKKGRLLGMLFLPPARTELIAYQDRSLRSPSTRHQSRRSPPASANRSLPTFRRKYRR